MEDFLAEWQRLLAWERDLQAESRELAERLGLAPPGLAADAAALSLADGPGPAESERSGGGDRVSEPGGGLHPPASGPDQPRAGAGL